MNFLRLILVVIFCKISTYASAQANTLKTAIGLIDTATCPATYKKAHAAFTEIAQEQPNDWLPLYFAAYSLISSCYVGLPNAQIDAYIDQADQLIIAASDKKNALPDEIFALKGYALSARIQVNAFVRGMKWASTCELYWKKAIAINKQNPRPYFLLGQSKFFTPKIAGGGKARAIPYLKTAQIYYQMAPAVSTSPNWGKKQCALLLTQCVK
jgi:hypothetical protein